MKRILLAALIAGCLCFASACATIQQNATPATAQTAAYLVCSNTIQLGAAEAERVAAANYVYAVAHAVRTLSGGNPPSPAELKTTLETFIPNGGKWSTLGVNVSSIWGAIYPRVGGNPKLSLDYLEAIARGCEEAAATFLPAKN